MVPDRSPAAVGIAERVPMRRSYRGDLTAEFVIGEDRTPLSAHGLASSPQAPLAYGHYVPSVP